MFTAIKDYLGFGIPKQKYVYESDSESDSEYNSDFDSDNSEYISSIPVFSTPKIKRTPLDKEKQNLTDEEEDEEKLEILTETKTKKNKTKKERRKKTRYKILFNKDSHDIINVPLVVNSNVSSFDYIKKIRASRHRNKWDFLTLYMALFYKLHNDNLPKKINNTLLTRKRLHINETNNYLNELSYLKNIFIKRYNTIKTLKSKLDSLKFLKNGLYIEKVNQLEKWNKKMTSQYIEEVKKLYDQDSLNIKLTDSEKLKLKEFEYISQKIKEYKQIVIGTGVAIKITNDKKEKNKMFKVKELEKINNQYKKSKIIDSQYNFKKVILSKPQGFVDSKDGIFLKSKMIYHLKNFFNINDTMANKLLEDNIFDTIINFDSKVINSKLNMINEEISSYEKIVDYFYNIENKVYLCPHCTYNNTLSINVIYHISDAHAINNLITKKINEKLFKCPKDICLFEHKDEKTVEKHMLKEHKLKTTRPGISHNEGWQKTRTVIVQPKTYAPIPYIKTTIVKQNKKIKEKSNKYIVNKLVTTPLLVIKPINNNGIYENVYDNFKSEKIDEVFHHMKMENKLIPKFNKNQHGEMLTTFTKLKCEMKLIKISNDMEINNKSFIKSNDKIKPEIIDYKNIDVQLLDNSKNNLEIVLKKYVKSKEIIKFLSRNFKDEHKKIIKITNDIIEQAKEFINRKLSIGWVDLVICKHFFKNIFYDLNDISIKMFYNNENIINFENIDNISDTIPKEVNINGIKLIENSKFIGPLQNIEISREDLINEIKINTFMQKVKIVCINLSNKITFNQNSNNVIEIKNKILEIIPNFFRKLIDWEDYEQLEFDKKSEDFIGGRFLPGRPMIYQIGDEFDRVLSKLGGINESNIHDRIHDQTNKNIDDYLFYLLMAFLPSDNEAVKNIYNILEEEEDNNSDFIYKNKIWNWNKKYDDNKKGNFKNLTKENIIEKIYKSEDLYLERFIIQNKIYENMDFNNYDNSFDTHPTYIDYKREKLISQFIYNCYQRKIIQKIDYKISMAMLFLNKINKALNISKKKSISNPHVVYYLLRIMDSYIDKPNIYKRISNNTKKIRKFSVKNRMNKTNIQDNKKEDLLNDFMSLNEDDMKIDMKIENEFNNSNVINDEDDFEIELQKELEEFKYTIPDENFDFEEVDDNEANFQDNYDDEEIGEIRELD